MLSQQQLLQRYKDRFSNLTFAQMSEHLGIKRGRIIRLFSGAGMRIDEYKKFSEVLSGNNYFTMRAQQCNELLPSPQLERLDSILAQYLDAYFLVHEGKSYTQQRNLNERSAG